MKHSRELLLYLVIFTGAGIYSFICFHSVEEIHYLKSFFPQKFTVQEVFYASAVELIKVIIIGIPFFLFIRICLVLTGRFRKDKDGQNALPVKEKDATHE